MTTQPLLWNSAYAYSVAHTFWLYAFWLAVNDKLGLEPRTLIKAE